MTTELSPNWPPICHALDATPSDAAIDAPAQAGSTTLWLAPHGRVRRPWFGWVAAAATGCLVLALVMLPTSQGIAFDTVQKHLRDFTTLSLTIEQQLAGHRRCRPSTCG